jgi:ZIP family zinc transporter
MGSVYFVLLISAATGLCTGVGSVPFFWVRSLPRRAYDSVLGFGAGLMLSAATLGLLSQALLSARSGGQLNFAQLALILLGFASGFVILFAVERLIPHQHAGGHHEHLREGARFHNDDADDEVEAESNGAHVRHGVLISGALVFHRLPEGFAIGASFAAGETLPLGFLVAISVALQNVCEGMVMSAPLRQGGVSRVRALLLTSATGLTVPVTAVVGYLFAQAHQRDLERDHPRDAQPRERGGSDARHRGRVHAHHRPARRSRRGLEGATPHRTVLEASRRPEAQPR